MNTNNNNNLQAAVYGNQINSAAVATRQTEQPNNGSGSNNNVNNSNNSANPVNPANPANQPYLRGSEQNSNSPKAIEQSQPHNNIRHSIDQNNNSHNSSNGNNNNASGQKAIGNGNLFDQTNNSNKQAQAQIPVQAQDSLKPAESNNNNSNTNNSNTSFAVLADPNNNKSVLERTTSSLSSLEKTTITLDSRDVAETSDFAMGKESDKSSTSGRSKKPKVSTPVAVSKPETEQTNISFSMSLKEKRQIDAIATLLDYESSEDFIREILSQDVQRYLGITSQALKSAIKTTD